MDTTGTTAAEVPATGTVLDDDTVNFDAAEMLPEGDGGIEKSSSTYRAELKRLWGTHESELQRSWHCVDRDRRVNLMKVCRKAAVNKLSNNMTFTEASFALICPELAESVAEEHGEYPDILRELVKEVIASTKEEEFKRMRARAPLLMKQKARIEFIRMAKCPDCETEKGADKCKFRYLYMDGKNDVCQHRVLPSGIINMFLIARRMMLAEGLHTGILAMARLIGVESDPFEGQSLFPKEACASCGRVEDPETEKAISLVCSRCKSEKYCSKDCQKRRWPEHKKICQPRVVPMTASVLPATAAAPSGRAGDAPQPQ